MLAVVLPGEEGSSLATMKMKTLVTDLTESTNTANILYIHHTHSSSLSAFSTIIAHKHIKQEWNYQQACTVNYVCVGNIKLFSMKMH